MSYFQLLASPELINTPVPPLNRTPAHGIAQHGFGRLLLTIFPSKPVIERLQQASSTADVFGDTPLTLAIRAGHWHIARIFARFACKAADLARPQCLTGAELAVWDVLVRGKKSSTAPCSAIAQLPSDATMCGVPFFDLACVFWDEKMVLDCLSDIKLAGHAVALAVPMTLRLENLVVEINDGHVDAAAADLTREGRTTAHFAAASASADVWDQVFGADPTDAAIAAVKVDAAGRSPFSMAVTSLVATSADLEALNERLGGSGLNLPADGSAPPLIYAAMAGNAAAIGWLTDHGAVQGAPATHVWFKRSALGHLLCTPGVEVRACAAAAALIVDGIAREHAADVVARAVAEALRAGRCDDLLLAVLIKLSERDDAAPASFDAASDLLAAIASVDAAAQPAWVYVDPSGTPVEFNDLIKIFGETGFWKSIESGAPAKAALKAVNAGQSGAAIIRLLRGHGEQLFGDGVSEHESLALLHAAAAASPRLGQSAVPLVSSILTHPLLDFSKATTSGDFALDGRPFITHAAASSPLLRWICIAHPELTAGPGGADRFSVLHAAAPNTDALRTLFDRECETCLGLASFAAGPGPAAAVFCAPDAHGLSPLHYALASGNTEAAELIYTHCRAQTEGCFVRDAEPSNPEPFVAAALAATEAGSFDALRWLHEHRATLDAPPGPLALMMDPQTGRTVIEAACAGGVLQCVGALLKVGQLGPAPAPAAVPIAALVAACACPTAYQCLQTLIDAETIEPGTERSAAVVAALAQAGQQGLALRHVLEGADPTTAAADAAAAGKVAWLEMLLNAAHERFTTSAATAALAAVDRAPNMDVITLASKYNVSSEILIQTLLAATRGGDDALAASLVGRVAATDVLALLPAILRNDMVEAFAAIDKAVLQDNPAELLRMAAQLDAGNCIGVLLEKEFGLLSSREDIDVALSVAVAASAPRAVSALAPCATLAGLQTPNFAPADHVSPTACALYRATKRRDMTASIPEASAGAPRKVALSVVGGGDEFARQTKLIADRVKQCGMTTDNFYRVEAGNATSVWRKILRASPPEALQGLFSQVGNANCHHLHDDTAAVLKVQDPASTVMAYACVPLSTVPEVLSRGLVGPGLPGLGPSTQVSLSVAPAVRAASTLAAAGTVPAFIVFAVALGAVGTNSLATDDSCASQNMTLTVRKTEQLLPLLVAKLSPK